MTVVLVAGLLLLVASLGGTAALLLRRRRAPRRAPGPPSLQGQLLFAASVGQGTVGLDCLLHRTSRPELVGQPVHLVVALPDSPALAAQERELLRAWLEGSEEVGVELSLADARPQVTLACNARQMTLSLPAS